LTQPSPRTGPKVHVLFRKEDLDDLRVEGKVIVVLDILFATSTIVAALAHGANDIIPTMDEWSARARAAELPEGSFVASGELYAETLPGFVSPTPLALVDHGIDGKTVVYSTTNGTVALQKSVGAAHVYAGAVLNGEALVERVCTEHPDETVIVVCSGSMGAPNLEDMMGAGFFVDLFAKRYRGPHDLTDSALAAHQMFRGGDLLDTLMRSRVGRMMVERDLVHEVEFAARPSVMTVVPRLEGTRLVA
jgi:2-phosphosulfolactate phosphatase